MRELLLIAMTLSLSSLAQADTFTYPYIFGVKKVGHLTAETKGALTSIDYDVPSMYLAQTSSPWANGIYARALLSTADKRLPALPGGAPSI